MKLIRTFYQLTAALAVLSIECVYGTDQTISLSLQVGTYERECSGGDGGLTNTSIEVQSRLLQGSSVVSEWCILIVIDPKQGFNGTLNIHYSGSSVNGIQLKLLQLEHGGGDCNCWMVEDVTIFMESRSVRLFGPGHYGYCSSQNNHDVNKFCGDAVRGFISKAATIPVSKLHSCECPAENYTFSVDRDPQPETCTTYTNLRNIGHNCSSYDSEHTNAPSDETSTNAPSVETSTTAPTSTSAPSAETSTSAPSTETSTSAPSAETSTSAPSTETSTSAPSTETSTSAPSTETSTSAPSAETSTSAPSTETSTSAPSTETSTSAPSTETSTSAPSAEIRSLSNVMILNTLSSSLYEYNLLNYDLKLILDSLEVFIDREHNTTEVPPEVIGSSLLSFVDRLALVAFQDEDTASVNGQIFIQTRLISAEVEGYIKTINSESNSDALPLMSIEIPSELVGLFAGSSGGDERVVRVISTLYYDVEHLFPGERLGQSNSSVLGSGIVSTGLQCGESLCDTTGINLLNPVVITIEHSKEKNDVISECVFWEFHANLENTSLTSGQWSNNDCYQNAELSNRSLTVCECYHLTHFAILLSPVPLKLNEQVVVSLQAIGYVGVTVSVVAMAITAITFISHKSLHNMRNYIHIHLCINLMIAQLIFVVGIDKSAEDHVPVHCQAIAVLLHYFFLVSFMWMLMEGVVLYFILIRVFVTNTKKYIIIFTLACYGIPLLYMGMVTLPLGYVLKNQHYGSKSFCFLNAETHFMWAFIAPVILIILLNIGFLIMAAVALWRHKKSQKGEMDRKSIAAWLKAVTFLVVVMGITWIVGLLVMEVEALLPLAYIFTIMVAFQGVAIFLSLVAFQKSVRDEYIKWFRRQKINKYFSKSSADTSTLTKKNEDKEERV